MEAARRTRAATPPLYAWSAGETSLPESAARRVSFSELLARPQDFSRNAQQRVEASCNVIFGGRP